jgi:phosphoribosylaminoimidazolecarboxamide formyltransferase/IMP cyclohydrolase
VLKTAYRTARPESLPDHIEIKIGDRRLQYKKTAPLRYGENPHQAAAHYSPAANPLCWVKDGKGGPSWTNVADIDHACKILRFFDTPAAVVMKHLNPSGAAQQGTLLDLATVYRAARECDSRAAFGGVAVVNRRLDKATAEAMLEGFLEVIAAPGFSAGALEVLESKKDLRLAQIDPPQQRPRFVGDAIDPEIRLLGDGSCLLQEPFLSNVRSQTDLHRAGLVAPSESQLEDLLFAWYVTTGVRSNAIVVAQQGRTLAVGTGQQERVGAVEQAIEKARQKGHDLHGAVVSSDGFFPFRDSIDLLAQAGIAAVIQPGGSVRDPEVVAACNEHGMALVFSEERCFGHF